MARRRSRTLTDAEARLMNVLWKRGRATVAEVAADLPGRPALAYTTVQTLLRILEEKGYVGHEKTGRAFTYRPIVAQRAVRQRAVGHLVEALFDDSPSLLVLDVLADERLDRAEIRRLKALIEKSS
jgi:predicted transcriptional regulator